MSEAIGGYTGNGGNYQPAGIVHYGTSITPHPNGGLVYRYHDGNEMVEYHIRSREEFYEIFELDDTEVIVHE